jgi:hypothetical protein
MVGYDETDSRGEAQNIPSCPWGPGARPHREECGLRPRRTVHSEYKIGNNFTWPQITSTKAKIPNRPPNHSIPSPNPPDLVPKSRKKAGIQLVKTSSNQDGMNEKKAPFILQKSSTKKKLNPRGAQTLPHVIPGRWKKANIPCAGTLP